MEIEKVKTATITHISSSHYVRSWYLDPRALKVSLPHNLENIKERIYENIRN